MNYDINQGIDNAFPLNTVDHVKFFFPKRMNTISLQYNQSNCIIFI